MPQAEDLKPDPQSKTQRKNDMLDLQKLGEKLIKLPLNQLEKIEMPDILRNAILLAHTLKTHESIRRHLQYIGKIMRHVDATEIRHAIMQVEFTNEQRTDAFHLVEEWREKLIVGADSALQEFMEAYPDADRQQIRQLVRKATQDRANEKNTGAEKALFRYLRTLLDS